MPAGEMLGRTNFATTVSEAKKNCTAIIATWTVTRLLSCFMLDVGPLATRLID